MYMRAMSLIGAKAEAAEHIVIAGEPTAEIQAISAQVGATASPSQPAAAIVALGDEAAFSGAARIVMTGTLIQFAVQRLRYEQASAGTGQVRVTKVTGFSWTS